MHTYCPHPARLYFLTPTTRSPLLESKTMLARLAVTTLAVTGAMAQVSLPTEIAGLRQVLQTVWW